MKRILCLAALALLLGAVDCAPSPTPTPVPPTGTPAPTATPAAEQAADYVPPDIPRCAGLQRLDRSFTFAWPGIDSVGDADWLYYHCMQTPESLAAAYRSKMTAAPYDWVENAWVELPEGKLGVYLHTDSMNWLYLWFLADASSPAASRLVTARRSETPLDLPCH